MRIALVIFGDLDRPSGGYFYDYQLVSSLREAGHEVAVVSQPAGLSYREQRRVGRQGRRLSIDGHEVLSAGGRRGRLDRTEALAAVRRLVEMRPDVMIIDELNHAATTPWLPRLQAHLRSTLTVGLVHHLRCDEGGIHRLARFQEAAFLRHCDAWICNSRETLRRVQRISGVKRSSAVAYPAGDSAGYRAGHGPRPTAKTEPVTEVSSTVPELRVLSVGTVIPRKNLHVLLRAVAECPETDLTVVGDMETNPAYVARLRELTDELGIARRVQFRGKVPSDVLEGEYAAAHVFAAPSRYEGFGIVYLEALGRGKPVIASNAGGAPEIVRSGVDGFLVKPGAVKEVVEALKAFQTDRRRLAKMSAAARARARAFLPWHRSMAGAARFVESLVSP